MQIVSINLNGIRSAARKGFFDWLHEQDFDVICLQETRAQLNSTDMASEFFPKDYYCFYLDAQKKGYSGVGIFSKINPSKIIDSVDLQIFNDEGRYLQLDFNHISIVSLYLPSGSSGETRQHTKFMCMEHYTSLLKTQRSHQREYIICGDWNIAHQPIDLKNWRSNQKNSGFLPEERAWLDTVFNDIGFVDAFRIKNQHAEQYTWWSNRGRAYEKNVGWRIDYQIITPNLAPLVTDVSIYKEQRFSDHAPVIVEYDDAIRALF